MVSRPGRALAVFSLFVLVAASFAQTTGSTTGSTIPLPNWNDAATSTTTGIGTMIQGMFPIAAGLIVLVVGVMWFRKLIKMFAK